MTKQEKTLQAIAIRTLNVQTLKVQNSDSLDFHTLSVWEIKAALKEAYAAGQKEGGAA